MNARPTFRLSILIVLAATLAAHAHGDPLVVFGNRTFARPASGTTTYTVSGTVTYGQSRFAQFLRGASITNCYIPDGAPSAGSGLFPSVAQEFLNYTPPTGATDYTYSGPLFTVPISATTPIGNYSYYGGYQPFMFIGYLDGGTGLSGNYPYYGVVVTQAVPEPGACAALGFGALALLRRRKRA